MKLGDALVRAGRIDAGVVGRALTLQTTLGGRFGTNLLEMGALDERTLLAALGEQKSCATVERSELVGIPQSEIRQIPAKLAKRYGVIPYKREGKKLWVASRDPSDLLVEDEISFLTGCMIRTSIALDLHIHEALATYYGVPLQSRYQVLTKRLRGASRSAAPAEVAAAPEAATPAPAAPASTIPAHLLADAPAPPKEKPREKPPAEKKAPQLFIELSEEETAALYTGDRGAAREQPPPAAAPATGPGAVAEAPAPAPALAPEPAPFEDLSEAWPEGGTAADRLDHATRMMQEAEIRDDIADALLGFCEPYVKRRLMLIKRKDRIIGWRAEGDQVQTEAIRAIEVPMSDPSVFLGLMQGAGFWLGPLPRLPANQVLALGLGGEYPKDCLVLPIVLRNQTVAFLYVDGGEDSVTGAPVPELRRLVAKAGLAFEVYILKNKIRTL